MNRLGIFQKIYFTLFILLIIVSLGIGGYMLIEGYSFSEAFYMTIITVSTVGFGEIHPLSESGRIFTAFLIIISLGIFAYGISIIAASILSGELTHFFKLYRLENAIQNLNSPKQGFRQPICCNFCKGIKPNGKGYFSCFQ